MGLRDDREQKKRGSKSLRMIQVVLATPSIMAFYGYCLLLGRKGYCRQDAAAFFVMSIIIVVLFISAWLGLLWPVTFALIAGGMAVAIFEMKFRFLSAEVDVVRKEGRAHPILLHLILAFGLFAVLIINKAQLFFWDDFSHWAVVSKDIFTRDAFPIPSNGVSIFYDYPPGSALAHYFFLFPQKLYGPGLYSEKIAMWAQGLMIISALGMLLTNAFKKGLLYFLIMFVTTLFAVFTYTEGFLTLMVDHVIGLYFAGCVICIVLGKNDNGLLLVVAVAALALSLLKLNAEYFSLAIIAMALINLFFKLDVKIQAKTLKGLVPPSIQRGVFIVMVSVVLIFLFRWIWQSHLDANGAPRAFDGDVSRGGAVSWLFNPTENEAKVSDKFISALMPGAEKTFVETLKSVTNNPFKIAFIPITLITVVVIFIGGDRARLGTLTAVVYAGFFSFCAGLLFFYQRSFNFNEAIHLVSFGRYVAQYFLAIPFLAFALILHAWTPVKNISLLGLALLIAATFLINPIPTIRIMEFIGITAGNREYLSAVRSGYNDFIEKYPFLRGNSVRAVIVWQCADGVDSLLMSYDLHPAGVARIPNMGFECGSTGSGGEEVFDRFPFRTYDYLIVAQSNDFFWSTYANRLPLLERDSRMRLYKIKSEGEKVMFIPL